MLIEDWKVDNMRKKVDRIVKNATLEADIINGKLRMIQQQRQHQRQQKCASQIRRDRGL